MNKVFVLRQILWLVGIGMSSELIKIIYVNKENGKLE
jgi:hypothetical protein